MSSRAKRSKLAGVELRLAILYEDVATRVNLGEADPETGAKDRELEITDLYYDMKAHGWKGMGTLESFRDLLRDLRFNLRDELGPKDRGMVFVSCPKHGGPRRLTR